MKTYKNMLWSFLIFITFLILWELVSGPWIKPFYISSPFQIMKLLIKWISTGFLWGHLLTTFSEMVIGFVIGCFIAIVFAFLLANSKVASDVFIPYINMFFCLPRIALVPVFVMWLGIGIASKAAIIILAAFFLVFFSTYTGALDVNKELVNATKLMGASKRQIFKIITLPSTYIWIFLGMRVAIPRCLIASVIAEIISSNRGLGYLISQSAGEFDTTGVLTAVLVLVIISLFLNEALNRGEAYINRWKM